MKPFIRLFICLFLLGLGACPLQAQTRSLISNLANPAIGFNALFKAQVAPDLNQPYGLEFEEAELSLISTVDPTWTLSTNLVFLPDATVDPEEVYATTTSIPDLLVKIGKIRGTFGKHGLLHTHAFPFIQAPLVMENTIGGEGFKDAGLEAAWLTPLPWFCELTGGAYQSIGTDADHPLDFGSTSHDNIPWLAHLKNQFDLDDETTMELGGSTLTGFGSDGMHHSAYGVDLTFRNVPLRQSNSQGWILQGEYIKKVSYAESVYNQEADGWYASFQYRLSQNWWTGIRAEEAFNSHTDVLGTDSLGNPLLGHIQKASMNIAWVPSEFSFIRGEYSIARADDGNGNTPMDHRFMVQFLYVIGFHPAHAY